MSSFAVINNGLKEFGDLANWAAVLEADMTRVAEALATTVAAKQQQQQQQQQQGTADDRRKVAAAPQLQPPVTAGGSADRPSASAVV